MTQSITFDPLPRVPYPRYRQKIALTVSQDRRSPGLDILGASCNTLYMPCGNKKRTLTELLRREIEAYGSIRAISLATGVTRQSMMKFVRGEQSLRLDMADRLADFFGIEIRPPSGTNKRQVC